MARQTERVTQTSATSSDLDAYRRHRRAFLRRKESTFLDALDTLKALARPQVVFARLAHICVPALADGAQIELSDGVEPPLRVLVGRPAGQTEETADHASGAVEVPFQMESRGGQPSYSGILILWWNERPIASSDWLLAELTVKYAASLVDRQRLMERVGTSEARAASAAMEAIASRQVNLAVGILMARSQCSAIRAETQLVDLADERGDDLYTVAARMVRTNHLVRSGTVGPLGEQED